MPSLNIMLQWHTYGWSNRATEQPHTWVEKQNNNARERSGRGGFELIAVTTRLWQDIHTTSNSSNLKSWITMYAFSKAALCGEYLSTFTTRLWQDIHTIPLLTKISVQGSCSRQSNSESLGVGSTLWRWSWFTYRDKFTISIIHRECWKPRSLMRSKRKTKKLGLGSSSQSPSSTNKCRKTKKKHIGWGKEVRFEFELICGGNPTLANLRSSPSSAN